MSGRTARRSGPCPSQRTARGSDPQRLRSLRDRGQHPHERPGADQGREQRGAGPAVREQVLQQVGPGHGLGVLPDLAVDLDPVQGVREARPAVRALDMHHRVALHRRAQGQGAGHLEPGGGADPDHRGVVAVDRIGPVQIGRHRVDVGQPAAVDHGQGRGHGVGQGVGDRAVDHQPPVSAAPAGPRRAGPVADRPGPGRDGADAPHRPDIEGVGPQHLQGLGPEALETHLDHPAGLPLDLQQPGEVGQRGHRRLLEVDVGTRAERGGRELEVGVDRRGDDHDVHRADGGQRPGQVRVEVRAVDHRRVQDDTGVDGRHQLDETLVGEPGDPVRVHQAEPAYADQDHPGRSVFRTRSGVAHR